MRRRWNEQSRRNRPRLSRALGSALACVAICVAVPPAPAPGALIVIETPVGAVVGRQPVNARATFTTSTDQVDILLENLFADPKAVGQNLSGLWFTLDAAPAGASLTASAGTERTVVRDGSFTPGGSVPTGWSLLHSGADLTLNVLGSAVGPRHTLIGPPNALSGEYDAANRSIAGNAPHNAFLGTSATFTIAAAGVLPTSLVAAATFQFNTARGFTTAGEVKSIEREVLDPAGAGLVMAGVTPLGLRRGCRRARAATGD